MARKSRRTQRLRVVNPDCAGIDIGKDRHFVAVEAERTEEPVRSFGAFTRDLEEMAAWLASCGVTKVAMESTSVYWIPVYETLERAGFEVMLVPPRMTKQIGGRKSDVLDCQWIWQLMSYGLLRGAFRPGDEVCPLRSYARQMRRLTGDRSRCVLHMQKALTEMNVRLDCCSARGLRADRRDKLLKWLDTRGQNWEIIYEGHICPESSISTLWFHAPTSSPSPRP